MEWFLKVVKNYAGFSGRAQRKEYWMFILFYMVFSILAGVVDGVIGTSGALQGALGLGLFVPSLAVMIRRLHDVGKSGWFFFVALIPMVGGLWLIITLAKDGDPGSNAYGENPKEIGGAEAMTASE